jgi:acetyl-CoA carboxylase carboxyltransferase component
MSWSDALEELARREAFAQQMGSPEKVKRQHDNGKLTVRERIDALVDAGSFREVGALTGTGQYNEQGELVHVTPSNVVMGRAQLDARDVVVIGDDFTVRGGANDGAVGDKMIYAEDMAYELRIPIVRLVDGTGGGGSVKNIKKKRPLAATQNENLAQRHTHPVASTRGVTGAGLRGRSRRGPRLGQSLLGDGQRHLTTLYCRATRGCPHRSTLR